MSTSVASPAIAAGADAYASIDAALNAARAWRRNRPTAPIRIRIEAGDYYVEAPLLIDAALSGTASAPTEIVAAPGATPRILGGRRLQAQWQPFRDRIWRTAVTGVPFDQLIVDGRPQVRARYPDYNPAIAIFGGFAADALSAERVVRWRDPAGGILHALHRARWGGMQIPMLGRHPDGSLALGEAVGNNRPSPPHATYRFVDNIFEELDAPGEWYLNRAESMLYFMPPPGMDLARATVEVSGARRLFTLQGTPDAPLTHVRLAGLHLAHTGQTFLEATEPLLRGDWSIAREAAIVIEHAEDVRVADNELTALGGNALLVSGYARRITISGNHIHDIGGSGISLIGRPSAVRSPAFRYEQFVDLAQLDRTPGPASSAYPAASRVEDNLIHDIGRVEKQVAGVELSMAMDITVAHNTIHDVPRAGININDGTWGGHVLEYNDVFDTVLETGDHGAFNSWGRDRFWHPDRATMDRINAANPRLWTLDVLRPIVLRYNRFHCDHGWDIDLDDGSSRYRVHHNVLLAGGLKMREGFDRAAWNNILINNGFHPHVWFAGSGDRFERNIVMTAHQPILVRRWDGTIDYNLFPSSRALAQAQLLGIDKHSAAGDPRFAGAARGDYRVAAGSPALALGFANFPMDRFGVTSARLKARMRKQAPVPSLISSVDSGVSTPQTLLGARIKTVTTPGEQSAAGLPEMRGVLVIAVQPDSLAAASGLRPGDVIVSTPADDLGAGDPIDDVGALLALHSARRWRGSQEVVVVRNQQQMRLRLLFVSE